MKKFFISLILLISVAFNYGCVEFLAVGVLTGAGELIKYTKTSIVHKTFTGSRQQVASAAMSALKKMGIQVKKIYSIEDRTKIYADTNDLHIKIKLDSLTSNTTKVSVNASKNKLVKDKATADEIISQINILLAESNPMDFRQTNSIKTIAF